MRGSPRKFIDEHRKLESKWIFDKFFKEWRRYDMQHRYRIEIYKDTVWRLDKVKETWSFCDVDSANIDQFGEVWGCPGQVVSTVYWGCSNASLLYDAKTSSRRGERVDVRIDGLGIYWSERIEGWETNDLLQVSHTNPNKTWNDLLKLIMDASLKENRKECARDDALMSVTLPQHTNDASSAVVTSDCPPSLLRSGPASTATDDYDGTSHHLTAEECSPVVPTTVTLMSSAVSTIVSSAAHKSLLGSRTVHKLWPAPSQSCAPVDASLTAETLQSTLQSVSSTRLLPVASRDLPSDATSASPVAPQVVEHCETTLVVNPVSAPHLEPIAAEVSVESGDDVRFKSSKERNVFELVTDLSHTIAGPQQRVSSLSDQCTASYRGPFAAISTSTSALGQCMLHVHRAPSSAATASIRPLASDPHLVAIVLSQSAATQSSASTSPLSASLSPITNQPPEECGQTSSVACALIALCLADVLVESSADLCARDANQLVPSLDWGHHAAAAALLADTSHNQQLPERDFSSFIAGVAPTSASPCGVSTQSLMKPEKCVLLPSAAKTCAPRLTTTCAPRLTTTFRSLLTMGRTRPRTVRLPTDIALRVDGNRLFDPGGGSQHCNGPGHTAWLSHRKSWLHKRCSLSGVITTDLFAECNGQVELPNITGQTVKLTKKTGEYLSWLVHTLRVGYAEAAQNIQLSQSLYNKPRAFHRAARVTEQQLPLHMNDQFVLVYTPATKIHDIKKLSKFWHGPYKVVGQISGEVTYSAAVDIHSPEPINVNRLKLYHQRPPRFHSATRPLLV